MHEHWAVQQMIHRADSFKVFAPHVNEKDKSKNKMIKNVADDLEIF